MWGPELAIMVAMISANAVFAAYEIALAQVGFARLQHLVDNQRHGARAALYMKTRIEASLAVVQLGITLVGAIAAAVGGAGAEKKVAPTLQSALGLSPAWGEILAIALVVVPLTIVTIIVGELIPKVFALRNAEQVCLALSPFMRGFSISVRPVVWLLETVVLKVMSWGERHLDVARKPRKIEIQELLAAATMARSSRLIGQREERIILGATEMQSRTVGAVMVPAEHMTSLDAEASLADNLIAAHLDMHTRFPVVAKKGDPQSIIGYVNFKDMVATLHLSPQSPGLRGIVRQLQTVGADEPIATCLERLLHERTHIALVRDPEKRVVGMITLEDILEELVGEIEDEYDRLPGHLVESGTAWIVGGGISLDQLKVATGIDLRLLPWGSHGQSLSDWVRGQLGRDARGGDVVERDGIRVMVRKVRRTKVLEAQVEARGT